MSDFLARTLLIVWMVFLFTAMRYVIGFEGMVTAALALAVAYSATR